MKNEITDDQIRALRAEAAAACTECYGTGRVYPPRISGHRPANECRACAGSGARPVRVIAAAKAVRE